MRTLTIRGTVAAVTAAGALALTGCPVPPSQYDLGFDAGFAQDDWYWEGYFDGYDMVDFEPILYEGSDIPELTDGSYDAGYYDGIWWAYNDGYFVDYRYAFIIGWSEGYDNAYYPDYLDFLAADNHTEYGHGGWIDGYNDGFSEGRIFGAADYEAGIAFDWDGALLDYEDGLDLYFEEIDLGTGVYGPVFLYEYGTDPALKRAAALRPGRADVPAIRRNGGTKQATGDLFRPLTTEAQQTLNVLPDLSLRSDRALRLESSWLDRINTYVGGAKSMSTANRSARAAAH